MVRRKRRGQGGGGRSSGAPSPVQQLGSSFDAAAQGMSHADPEPEPEEPAEPLTPRSEGREGEDADADGGPGGSGSKKTTPLRELQREKKAQAKWKPGGEFGPRSHPFLKESPRYTAQGEAAHAHSTYRDIPDHLAESPPDHHKPIPASLTASFVDAGVVRERGLAHGGSAAEGRGAIPLSEEEQLAKVGAELAASKERYAPQPHRP